MPAILARADWPAWLGEKDGDPLALLRPCPEEWLRFWPVSSRVGKVSENDSGLLQRDALAPRVPGLEEA